MKISIDIDSTKQDTEISVSCKSLTPEIEKIIATLRMLNQQIMVEKEQENKESGEGDVLK